MQCEECGEREAKFHLTQIVNNQIRTVNLCEACASEKGLEPGAATVGDLPLTEFLAQVGQAESGESPSADGQCAFCGLRIDEFKKTGRLGCSHCYVTFEPHLRTLLQRLHGAAQHVGKVYLPPDPTKADRQERLAGLRRKLSRAVQSEDFERAARIRDQIRELEAAL